MNDDYIPISCALHSEYELAVMHKKHLRIHWKNRHGISHIEMLQPTNLRTKHRAEFMIAINQLGQRRIIRLDRICHIDGL